MSNTEVIIPEVIENDQLDKTITTTLQKHNVTEAVISSLKDKYGALRLSNVDDKEGYIEIKEAKKEVRKWGIAVEKICKKGREEAISIQKKWLSKEKEVLAKIAEVEDPLQKEIDRYESEVKRKEEAEAKRKEDAYMQRQSTLVKMGATYDNGSFCLNGVSYEVSLIKECDQEMWDDTILPKYRREFEKNESVRIAEEKKKEAEAEALRIQREDLERQQRELKEAQDKLQREREESDRRIRLEQEQRESAERKARQDKVDNRINKLRSLGLMYNAQYDSYIYEDVAISRVVEVERMTDSEWDALIEKTIPTIDRCKKEAEEKRIAHIEEQKRIAAEQAAQKERERIAEQQRQDELRKAEELAQSSDKEKWVSVVSYLNGIQWHDMKSGIYRKKVAMAKEKIEEIKEL